MRKGISAVSFAPPDVFLTSAVNQGIRPIVLFLVAVLSVNAARGQTLGRFRAYFPQVVKGNQIETLILLNNPHPDPIEVTLLSDQTPEPLLPRMTLRLEPGETQRVRIAGDDFRAESVRYWSAKAISATAHILIRSSSGSNEVISQVILRAQEAASKVVIPVFRKVSGSSEDTFADDTGIAIAALQYGEILLTLRDNSGKAVASRSLQNSRHTAAFLGELFSQVPADFNSGSVTIEHIQPQGIPRAFTAAAVYVRGNEMWSAEVTPVDRPATYGVAFKTADQKQAQEMAVQYGFTINSLFLVAPDWAVITASDEVAKALSRDPRVRVVEADQVAGGQ